jgi:hypothetical protein
VKGWKIESQLVIRLCNEAEIDRSAVQKVKLSAMTAVARLVPRSKLTKKRHCLFPLVQLV